VEVIGTLQRSTLNFIPVFLTDSADHGPFIRLGYVYEYFPVGIFRTFAGRLDFDRVLARLMTIRSKWSARAVIDMSAPTDLRSGGYQD
jgi:hypothetical protein